ncbi:MAG TPA: hypothetical protein VJN18_14400 [Polyangiaceae bacterium]|nr:hypothetical protein [Polyangiaceae bacterium]
MRNTSSVRKVEPPPARRVIDLTDNELADAVLERLLDALIPLLEGSVMPPSEYLTRKEAAELLRISTAQLDILSRRDVDPLPYEQVGDSRRYVRADVHSWVRLQRKARAANA